MFGNMHDPRAALLRASLQLKAGGHIVISHPMGRAWHSRLAAAQPAITPHALPSAPVSRLEWRAWWLLLLLLPLPLLPLLTSLLLLPLPPLPLQELDRMVAGLPLRVVELADEPELYLAVLQVGRVRVHVCISKRVCMCACARVCASRCRWHARTAST